ncbi:hypothetical protein IJ541_01275 [bacterium]|nr:hypothetical protein [bacterium]
MVTTRDKIKSFIALNGIYIKKLAVLMSEKSGKNFTEDSLGGKIRRESITFKEVELLADVLGYSVEFIKK